MRIGSNYFLYRLFHWFSVGVGGYLPPPIPGHGGQKRRCADISTLKRAGPHAEAGIKQEPRKIDGAPFLFDEPGGHVEKTSDVNSCHPRWALCVRAMCRKYLQASDGDDPSNAWRNMDGV